MTRILDFDDAFTTATAPDVIDPAAADGFVTYASDAAYEAAKGSAGSAGDAYFNTTTERLRIHNGTGWQDGTGTIDMVREVPSGVINGLNDTFTLSFVPISDQHVSIYLDGNYQEDTEVSFSSNTVTFTTPPATGQSVFAQYVSEGTADPLSQPVGTEQLIYHEVTVGEAVAKQFFIGSTPGTPAKTLVDVIGGTSQHFGVDFTISGSTFDWDGFGLDGTLAANDVVRLRFLT